MPGPFRIRNWQVRYCLMFERFGLAGGIGALVGAAVGLMLEHGPLSVLQQMALATIVLCGVAAITVSIISPMHHKLRLSHKDWITSA